MHHIPHTNHLTNKKDIIWELHVCFLTLKEVRHNNNCSLLISLTTDLCGTNQEVKYYKQRGHVQPSNFVILSNLSIAPLYTKIISTMKILYTYIKT
jgi:hypothetical protein